MKYSAYFYLDINFAIFFPRQFKVSQVAQKLYNYVGNHSCIPVTTTEHVSIENRINLKHSNHYKSHIYLYSHIFIIFLTLSLFIWIHFQDWKILHIAWNIFNSSMSNNIRALSVHIMKESWLKYPKTFLWKEVFLW